MHIAFLRTIQNNRLGHNLKSFSIFTILSYNFAHLSKLNMVDQAQTSGCTIEHQKRLFLDAIDIAYGTGYMCRPGSSRGEGGMRCMSISISMYIYLWTRLAWGTWAGLAILKRSNLQFIFYEQFILIYLFVHLVLHPVFRSVHAQFEHIPVQIGPPNGWIDVWNCTSTGPPIIYILLWQAVY